MNDDTVQQLGAAIQMLAAEATAQLAAGPAPPAPTYISPYEGDVLDLSSHLGTAIFHYGCAVLLSKFTRKVEDLHMSLADQQNRAQPCCWKSSTHNITAINTFNLLDDYGKLMAAQVEAACVLHTATHASLHAFECTNDVQVHYQLNYGRIQVLTCHSRSIDIP